MKVNFTEQEGCFAINMVAETMQDVVVLARFGMNKTKEIRSYGAIFNRDGSAEGYVVVGKRKDSNNYMT